MPRCARLRGPDLTYHIMVRSISEIPLYGDTSDKDRYLKTLKKYQDMFYFKVYAYCLMDTHAHFIIYSNGSDISKIMHGVNQSYAQYYNRKYGRHGHLFQDRFKSKVVKDDKYLISLSGYIHNNADDIKKYKGHVEKYPYSSMGIFLGIRRDDIGLVDFRFILEQISRDIICAKKQYREFIKACIDINELPKIEFKDELTEYRSQKAILVREYSIDEIGEYITNKMGLKKIMLSMKHCSRVTAARSLYVLLLRSFCDLECVDICKAVGNITQSRVSKLCSIGIDMVQENDKYRKIIDEFIRKCKTA